MQNRVNPFGDIIDTSARGCWLGNRGQLHGKGKTILRLYKHKAWIICLLDFKSRHRQIMAPNLWTELFFLDEATAMAAGHRPCFECRREDAKRFKIAWIKGNPEYGFDLKTPIAEIDNVLQSERIDINKKITFTSVLKDLPNGTHIAIEEVAYMIVDQLIYPWTAFGYLQGREISLTTIVDVLTPKSIVNSLNEGYQLQISLPNI